MAAIVGAVADCGLTEQFSELTRCSKSRAKHSWISLAPTKIALDALLEEIGQGELALRHEQIEAPRRRKRGTAKSAVLSTKSMEQMLWDAACKIRGEKDAPKFKDYILPLIFIKRLSDVFEDEVLRLTETYGAKETALEVLEADHSLVRFYVPPQARWPVVSGREQFAWPDSLETDDTSM